MPSTGSLLLTFPQCFDPTSSNWLNQINESDDPSRGRFSNFNSKHISWNYKHERKTLSWHLSGDGDPFLSSSKMLNNTCECLFKAHTLISVRAHWAANRLTDGWSCPKLFFFFQEVRSFWLKMVPQGGGDAVITVWSVSRGDNPQREALAGDSGNALVCVEAHVCRCQSRRE